MADAGANGATPNAGDGAGQQGGGAPFENMTPAKLAKELASARETAAALQRTVANREAEAKRVHEKYEAALKDIGDEKGLDEYRSWQQNRAKEEEERLRKEGNLEKLLAAREKALAERESEIQSLRSENFRAAIHGELSREATALEAVSASQVLRMFGDPADWVRNGKGEIVASPDGSCRINASGNAALATAGTGDVLAGWIGGLWAQGLDTAMAVALGVFSHGAAADRWARRLGHVAPLIAGRLIEELVTGALDAHSAM